MNDKAYIHEFIDIRGHHRADYMHHMAANWSPLAQETRNQRCFGVFAVLGSTGPWPQVVNLWEEDGFAVLAASFAGEAVGAGAQDPALAKWWAKAAEFRRGGFDRIVRPAPWTRTIDELCADVVQQTDIRTVRQVNAIAFIGRSRHGREQAGAGSRQAPALRTPMLSVLCRLRQRLERVRPGAPGSGFRATGRARRRCTRAQRSRRA